MAEYEATHGHGASNTSSSSSKPSNSGKDESLWSAALANQLCDFFHIEAKK
jgi:hypothetical protein